MTINSNTTSGFGDRHHTILAQLHRNWFLISLTQERTFGILLLMIPNVALVFFIFEDEAYYEF